MDTPVGMMQGEQPLWRGGGCEVGLMSKADALDAASRQPATGPDPRLAPHPGDDGDEDGAGRVVRWPDERSRGRGFEPCPRPSFHHLISRRHQSMLDSGRLLERDHFHSSSVPPRHRLALAQLPFVSTSSALRYITYIQRHSIEARPDTLLCPLPLQNTRHPLQSR